LGWFLLKRLQAISMFTISLSAYWAIQILIKPYTTFTHPALLFGWISHYQSIVGYVF
jgi:hypothetical protein